MKNKKKLIRAMQIISVLIPGIIGFIGFATLDNIPLTWALYYTVRLYGLNTDITSINTLIEIARWTAPLATASIAVYAVTYFSRSMKHRFNARRKGSCTVFGESPYAAVFLDSLGNRGVKGSQDKMFKTDYYVLMFDTEQENLQFYYDNKKKMKNKVYIHVNDLPSRSKLESGLVTFSLNENCARQYWAEFPAGKDEKIAIIGESELRDELVTSALLQNVISTDQHISYYVISKTCDYQYIHTQLSQITMDTVEFIDSTMEEQFELLAKVDRIILCDNFEINMKQAGKCVQYLPVHQLHIRYKDAKTVQDFFGKQKVVCFGDIQSLATPEVILEESLYRKAKEINEYYRRLYGGVEWKDLSDFKKQSNLTSAMYVPVLKRLHEQGVSQDTLAELEHIRWNRFHYLNNWHYGEQRNDLLRIHHCLVPFHQLSETDKDKDRNNVKLALQEKYL